MTWEQTADVLAKEVDRLQKENDRLRDGIEQMLSHAGQCEGVTNIMAVMARIEWIEGIGKETLSHAAEGGGAANGGESKIPTCPLCEKKMVARNVFNSEDNLNWVMGVCDSCSVYSTPLYSIDPQKALDAAVLGLHTLAGEFPTAMFETRKDYLKATISEINEIIGKQ